MLQSKLVVSLALATMSLGAAADGGDITVDALIRSSSASGAAAFSGRGPLTAASTTTAVVVNGERGIVFVDPPLNRSRAEVVAELREATRLGVTGGGEAGPRPATAAEEAQIRQAGRGAARDATAKVDSPR